MSYKTLLTHVVADGRTVSRLRMTASVARVLGAEVIGLGAQAPWPFASADAGRRADFKAILRATEDGITSAEAMFRQLLKEPGITTAWRAEVGYPDAVMAKHARRADLIVAYRTRGDADTSVYATPDDLVMEAGLPVLLLPTNEAEFQAKAVLLAWKNTPEMRRAISVAMPVLRDAERVLVAAVCRAAQIMAVEQELADVAERLAKNGVRATVLAQAAAPGAAGPKLRGIAEAHGSDLIVAGAYGHSRLREWMLGGATRDLIADGRRYVLLSH